MSKRRLVIAFYPEQLNTINELVMNFHDKKGITILWDNRQDQLRPLGQFGG
ncbi:hypothetical protein AND4_07819 [Vibrio sp. AND4]|nr:hypothetical protein AND4_07819 [Vibrio sp. AND4]